jgi:hypothetical protein
MKNLTVIFRRRSLLAAGVATIAGVAALAAWAQNDNSTPLPFGHLNDIGVDGTPVKTPPAAPSPGTPAAAGVSSSNLHQVELAATSLQIVPVTGGVAFWDPVKRLIYVYQSDFSVCNGVYQMGAPGQPMQRVGP